MTRDLGLLSGLDHMTGYQVERIVKPVSEGALNRVKKTSVWDKLDQTRVAILDHAALEAKVAYAKKHALLDLNGVLYMLENTPHSDRLEAHFSLGEFHAFLDCAAELAGEGDFLSAIDNLYDAANQGTTYWTHNPEVKDDPAVRVFLHLVRSATDYLQIVDRVSAKMSIVSDEPDGVAKNCYFQAINLAEDVRTSFSLVLSTGGYGTDFYDDYRDAQRAIDFHEDPVYISELVHEYFVRSAQVNALTTNNDFNGVFKELNLVPSIRKFLPQDRATLMANRFRSDGLLHQLLEYIEHQCTVYNSGLFRMLAQPVHMLVDEMSKIPHHVRTGDRMYEIRYYPDATTDDIDT